MKRYLFLVIILGVILTGCGNLDTSNNSESNKENIAIKSGEVINEELNTDGTISEESNIGEVINDEEKDYLVLNQTKIVDIMSKSQQCFEYDELGNIVSCGTYDLGNIKIGDSKYTLKISNIENSMKLSLINNDEIVYDLYEG